MNAVRHHWKRSPTTDNLCYSELQIPDQKPPKEKVVEVRHRVCVTKVVLVPIIGGKGCLTGCKVLVNGVLRLGVEYSAAVPEQSLHFAHFDVGFQELILGEPCFQMIPPHDCDLKKFRLHVCVEHLQVHQLGPRTLEQVSVLLLWLERRQPCK